MTNCYLLIERFRDSQIVIITSFFVVSSVGIKRIVCISEDTQETPHSQNSLSKAPKEEEIHSPSRADFRVKSVFSFFFFLILLGFNDTSTLVGHFVSSPRETEKRDRRDSRGDEREGRKKGTGMKRRNRRNKNIPLYPYLLQG